MNKIALLINGISLPHDLLDKSLLYAKGNKVPVKAVFVYENVEEVDYELPAGGDVSKADFSDLNRLLSTTPHTYKAFLQIMK